MNRTEWDALCRRCGRCCYEKLEFEGQVYYTDTPCDKLDPETALCTVYTSRHTAKPQCMALTQASLDRGILPADCPYVADIPNYNAPRLWDDTEE